MAVLPLIVRAPMANVFGPKERDCEDALLLLSVPNSSEKRFKLLSRLFTGNWYRPVPETAWVTVAGTWKCWIGTSKLRAAAFLVLASRELGDPPVFVLFFLGYLGNG